MNDYTGKKVRIINTNGFEDEKYGNLENYINQIGVIKYDHKYGYRFVINFKNENINKIDLNNGLLNFQIENIEFIDDNIIKPPLGVTPKYIFEIQRIQNLTRALYEYAHFNPSDMNYSSMLDWTKELFERLETQYLNNTTKV